MHKSVLPRKPRTLRRTTKYSPKATPKSQAFEIPRRPLDLRSVKQIPVLQLNKLGATSKYDLGSKYESTINSSRDSSRRRRIPQQNLSAVHNKVFASPKGPALNSSMLLPKPPQSMNNTMTSPRSIASSSRSGTSRKNSKDHTARSIEQFDWPITPAIAHRNFSDVLTAYEQGEILDYKEIFYLGEKAQKIRSSLRGGNNHGYDDENSDYKLIKHDHVAYRFEIIKLLGRGSFGQVAQVYDHKLGELVALKVIKNKEKFHVQGKVEVKVLKHLKKCDVDENYHVIHIKDSFNFRNHLIITFELLSINLYEFLKGNSFQGLSSGLIRRFAIQLLQGLRLMEKLEIIHCDLKPENVLLKKANKSGIKIIDLGSSCYADERIYTYIQSRFYRAPEIILGIPYTTKIDMWSFGCIMAELCRGYPIFPGESESEQIQLITSVRGLPPADVMAVSTRKKHFFDRSGDIIITENSRGKKHHPGSKPLHYILQTKDPKFLDFVEKCLEWNPEKRMSPSEAMRHDWISDALAKPPTSSRDSSRDSARKRNNIRRQAWITPRDN